MSAFFFALMLTFAAYERGCGPNVVPPCRHSGERVEPCRERPVPFCFQGFLPPPDTMLRVLVAWVPLRRPAR